MSELLPCPFCRDGGRPMSLLASEPGRTPVWCMDCGATADSPAAWNARYERTCRNLDGGAGFRCSRCGERRFLGWGEQDYARCPGCGARVIEE